MVTQVNNRELYEVLHSHVQEILIDDRVRTHNVLNFIVEVSTKNVLDLGCGRGEFLSQLQNNFLVGIDIVKNSFLSEYYNFVCGDARSLPFKSKSFKMITCFELIEHLDPIHLKNIFIEAKRVIKDDGILYVSTPNKYSVFNFLNDSLKDNQFIRKLTGRPLFTKGLKQHIKVYSFKQLLSLFSKYGFEMSRYCPMNLGFSVLLAPFYYPGRFQLRKLFPVFSKIIRLDWKMGKLLSKVPNIHFGYMFELKLKDLINE